MNRMLYMYAFGRRESVSFAALHEGHAETLSVTAGRTPVTVSNATIAINFLK
jgi:hypothetical protein